MVFGLILMCSLSNVMLIWYRQLLIKYKEDFQLNNKETRNLGICSVVIQGLLIAFNPMLARIGYCIPYLLIQGYTDYKTGYVYRKPSIVIGIIAFIFAIFTIRDIHIPSFIVSIVILLIFCIFSCVGALGWGDTITFAVLIIVFLTCFKTSGIVFWLLLIFLTGMMFSVYTICAHKKTAPFLPHLTLIIIILLIIFSIFLA